MESSKWNEEDIQKQLEKMPPVKDKRSREVIFHEIEARMEASKHKQKISRTWLMPGIATACLLVILMVLMPGTFTIKDIASPSREDSSSGSKSSTVQESSDSKSSATHEENKMKSAEPEEGDTGQAGSQKEAAKPNEPQDNGKVVNNPENEKIKSGDSDSTPLKAADTNGNYHPPLMMEEAKRQSSAGNSLVTVAYSDDQARFVVPVSFMVKGNGTYVDKVEEVLGSFKPEQIGLQPTVLNKAKLTEKDGAVIMNLPQGSVTSSEEALLPKILGYTFAFQNKYADVKFMSGDENGYEFSAMGPKDELNISEVRGGSSYLYTSPSGDEFFVDSGATTFAKEEVDLQSALDHLSEGYKEQDLMPAVPADVKLTASNSEGLTSIHIEHQNELANDEQTRKMLDAALVTAKNYTKAPVAVTNTNLEAVGPYNLEGPIDEIASVNFVETK